MDALADRKLRIAQVITPSKIAGAERSTLRLCHELAARGHTVSLICKAGHALNAVAQSEGLDVHPMKISGKLNLVAPVRLAMFAKQHRIDLIATQLSTASLWGSVAGRMLGVPVVATVRALNTKTCYMFADRLIAVSQAAKEHLVSQGVSSERIDVVYNGIDLNRFQTVVDTAEAKRALGISPERVVFGVVAHLSPKKGHAWFLEAAAMLRKTQPDAYFMFLGEGDTRNALAAQASAAGISEHLHFAGFQSDVRPWMAAMDVVVLPTIAKEGFGRVLVEAGAMNKAVITSQVGGVVEVVAHETSGLLVPTGDVAALCTAMQRLAADPNLRHAMGQAGRQRAEQLFDVQLTVANTERVYLETLKRVQKSYKLAA